ncbi:hypothetical protein [Endozoicomonas sp.]|uniref:ZrgA family zinc uptake protein n=1 Tax=Endozoicomonas sp. TaxID=1892382 RepID=UPI0028870410|nr:hypothetical protein [Endozoicomonas sp.]
MQTKNIASTLRAMAFFLRVIMQASAKWVVFFFLILPGLESRAEILLHRAVEPARMGLDISISGENLTVYIVIKEESLSFLNKKMDSELMFDQLQRMPHFALPASAARCRVIDQSVHREPGRINGYQTFQCQRPEQLRFIEVKLYEALPDLKAVDVWLTTENWQNKTVVFPEKLLVLIKSGIL